MIVVHCSIFFSRPLPTDQRCSACLVMANDVHGVFTWVAARGKAVLDG